MRHLVKKLDGGPAIAMGVLVLGAVAYGAFYTYRNLEIEKSDLLAQLESERAGKYEILKELQVREDIINSFQGQINEISGAVGTLEKLSQTDEELLKKYSKVYFLNENYVPPALADIEEKYLLQGSKNFLIYAKVEPYLRKLLEASHADGHNLLVASAYRSFETQMGLKSAYTVTYGSGANKFSADQGYSEHQLGTTVDFTTEKLGANFSAFASDPAYNWLLDHAHKYGFILSYPPNNAYYKYEPWHWRYVGVALATDLYDKDQHFYDLDQREIDKYLIKLFD
jgi:LAS superfamily LD-carboxypeptidase LdcB